MVNKIAIIVLLVILPLSVSFVLFAQAQEEPNIFTAIKSGDTSLVRKVIEKQKINWDQINEQGITALHAGVLYGNAEIVRVLLDAGAKTDPEGNRYTPLMDAVFNSKPQIALTLIQQGAKINTAKEGVTTLGIVTQTGDLEVATELLKAGADVNLESSGIAIDGDNRPCSPLIWASQTNVEIAKLLIRSGANVNAKDPGGSTALMLTDSLELVEELIKAGADVNTINSGGWTALMYVAGASKVSRIHSKAAHLSVHRDRRAEVLLTEGKTPLEVAIILNREIAEELIKAGANIDTRDKSGKTALDIAKSVKRVEIIELLSGSSNQRK